MKLLFKPQAKFVRNHPVIAIALILAITATLGGLIAIQETTQDPSQAFIPKNSNLIEWVDHLHETFPHTNSENIYIDQANQPTQKQLQEITEHPNIKKVILNIQTYETNPELTTPQGTLTIITLSKSNPEQHNQAQETIKQLTIKQQPDTQIYSNYHTSQEINDTVTKETIKLMAIALGIITIFLLIFYKSIIDTLLNLVGLAITITWVMGLQAILGPNNLGLLHTVNNPMIILIPVLLISLTIDYGIQITTRYREALHQGNNTRDAMQNSVLHTGTPLFLAALTTAASFLANLISDIPAVRDFAILAASGVIMGYLIMTLSVTAMRLSIDALREKRRKFKPSKPIKNALPGLAKAITLRAEHAFKYPIITIVTIFIITGAAALTISNVEPSFNETDFINKNSPTHDTITKLETTYNNNHNYLTLFITGNHHNPEFLNAIFTMENQLTKLDHFNQPSTQSLQRLAQHHNINTNIETKQDVETLHNTLKNKAEYKTVMDGHHSLITIKLDTANPAEIDKTLEQIQIINNLFIDQKGTVIAINNHVISQEVTSKLIDSQAQSTIITIIIATILLLLYFTIADKQPMLAIIAIIPIIIALIWIYGYMELRGITFNVMTALITAITIGVGVDYTIHVTHRYSEEYQQTRKIKQALHTSLTTTGTALIGSALTTALGFVALIFSKIQPIQQFGELVTITMVTILITTLLCLPPLLVLWTLYHQWQNKHKPQTITLRCPHCKHQFTTKPKRKIKCPQCHKQGKTPQIKRIYKN